MREIELQQGAIEYRELGTGAPVVFVHGLMVDGQLWMPVAGRLSAHHRCIVPDWPLGSHRRPMRADADLSPDGVARLVADFIAALDLRDVTLVGNDSGGVISQLVAARHGDRVRRLVLTNCDALEVFPPPSFAYLRWLPFVPGLMAVLAHAMRWFAPLRRLPVAYGSLTSRPLPAELLRAWVETAIDPAVRRDTAKFLRGVDRRTTLAVADELRAVGTPTRLVWGTDDPFFTVELAVRLRDAIGAELVPVPHARTFSPLDEPAAVADAIARFAEANVGSAA
jgi:pimeloyl-ACP methyl ester carboxylesterase